MHTGVLFINSPFESGADTWIQALLMRSLDRSRFEVHAACAADRSGAPSPASKALAEIPGLRLRPTEFGPSFYGLNGWRKAREAARVLPAVASLLGLARYVRRHRITILHSSDRPRDVLACALLARATGARSVIHVHVKFDRWISRGVRWGLAGADALIGVSRFVADTLVAGGYAAEKTHAVLNSIVPSDWDPAIDPGPVRAELGLAAGAPVIASVSRLFRWKGHDLLIRAFAEVRKALPGARLLIVGQDYPPGSGVTAELRALASSLDLGESVLFAGQRRDVARLIAAADVFALASFEEPFGLVYAEAMALRRPVAALANGGTPEVVEHGRTGLLSPPADAGALATNLLTLLRDPALRKAMGDAGRARALALFSPERLARDCERVYDSLS